MKVMCIEPIVNIADGCHNWPRPEVGDIDTVVKQKTIQGHLYYGLERFEARNGFLAECFATLPDTPAEVIEETELQTA